MEQIVVQVKDKEKAKILFELLAALSFVDSVKASASLEAEAGSTIQEDALAFFSLAGLWQDRDVTLTSIRQKVWPRQHT